MSKVACVQSWVVSYTATQVSVNGETAAGQVSRDPFYTLRLDIKNTEVWTLEEALRVNFSTEELQDYKLDDGHGDLVEARKTTRLGRLPPILIVNLKRYEAGSHKKIMKFISFGTHLRLEEILLTEDCNPKKFPRDYKLCAVVRHIGKFSTGGHYVSDVFRAGSWFHCDDTSVRPTDVKAVLSSHASNTAVLLFYQRADQVVG